MTMFKKAKHARRERPFNRLVTLYESSLLSAIHTYQEGDQPRQWAEDWLEALAPREAHTRRHREPGRHARRWDA